MFAVRAQLSLWLLMACWSVTPGMAWSQGPRLGSEDVAMLDALAVLLFDLEEGRPRYPHYDRARRQPVFEAVTRRSSREAVTYESIALSPYYGDPDKEYQDRAASRYERHHFVLKPASACVIRVDETRDYSLKESREVFGQNALKTAHVFNLSQYRRFELTRDPRKSFLADSSAGREISLDGDKVWCRRNDDKPEVCSDWHDHHIDYSSYLVFDPPESEWKSFLARREKAVEVVRKRCPPQPG